MRNAIGGQEFVHAVPTAAKDTMYDPYKSVRQTFGLQQGIGQLYAEIVDEQSTNSIYHILQEDSCLVESIPGYVPYLVIQDTRLVIRDKSQAGSSQDDAQEVRQASGPSGSEHGGSTPPDHGDGAPPASPNPSKEGTDKPREAKGKQTRSDWDFLPQGRSILVKLTQDDGEDVTEREARLWVEAGMRFEELHLGARKLFHMGESDRSKAMWLAGYQGQGYIRVRIEDEDRRQAGMLPHYISKSIADKLTLVVLSEPRRIGLGDKDLPGAGKTGWHAAVGQMPTRVPV